MMKVIFRCFSIKKIDGKLMSWFRGDCIKTFESAMCALRLQTNTKKKKFL